MKKDENCITVFAFHGGIDRYIPSINWERLLFDFFTFRGLSTPISLSNRSFDVNSYLNSFQTTEYQISIPTDFTTASSKFDAAVPKAKSSF